MGMRDAGTNPDENVVIVRRAIGNFSRGELQMRAGATPTLTRSSTGPAPRAWTGACTAGTSRRGVFMGTFHELFERVQVDPEEVSSSTATP